DGAGRPGPAPVGAAHRAPPALKIEKAQIYMIEVSTGSGDGQTNARTLMRPGAVLFGSTVIGSGVSHNMLGRKLLESWNRRGIYSNLDDDLATLESLLAELFQRHEVRLNSRMALFTAWA